MAEDYFYVYLYPYGYEAGDGDEYGDDYGDYGEDYSDYDCEYYGTCNDEYGEDYSDEEYGDDYDSEYGGDLWCDFHLAGTARGETALHFEAGTSKEVQLRTIEFTEDSDYGCEVYTLLVGDLDEGQIAYDPNGNYGDYGMDFPFITSDHSGLGPDSGSSQPWGYFMVEWDDSYATALDLEVVSGQVELNGYFLSCQVGTPVNDCLYDESVNKV
jgi:hypothetical protein